MEEVRPTSDVKREDLVVVFQQIFMPELSTL